ncbi:MAG: YcaO-like family protein [Candidatus Paceibacterota bacterium]|jgi:ribosomal protein S12 methylthiotransferase accessory factor
MNPIPFIEETGDSLLHGVPAKIYITQKIVATASPFLPIPIHMRIKIACAGFVLRLAEIIIGTEILVKNELREFFFIDARIRSLLLRLARKKIIMSWDRVPQYPDSPPIIHYRIKLGAIALPSGERVHISGSQGSGTGGTKNEALMLATAEALERYSTAVWGSKNIVRGSYVNLAGKGAIDPRQFSFFSDNQLKNGNFSKSLISETKEIGWVSARSILDKDAKYLIPAQLAYLFYENVEPNDCHFMGVSTSGVAAHSSYNRAAYRALCEVIERDALMIFWLNKLVPPRIELKSITIPKVRECIKSLQEYGFELHITDITTDFNMPAFCAVLIDRRGGVAVSISATADYDVGKALERLMLEIMKFAHIERVKSSDDVVIDEKQFKLVCSFNDRARLWSNPKMIEKINFFVSGGEKNFSEVIKKHVSSDTESLLGLVEAVFREKNYQCYLVDVTSMDAKEEGLVVVRAVSPDLVPVYFDEKERPCGVKRLYTAPVTMKYREAPTTEDGLNQIPHPFM